MHSCCSLVDETNRLAAAATNKHCWLSDGKNIRLLRQRASSSGMGLALYRSAGSRVDHWHMAKFCGLESAYLHPKGLLTKEELEALPNTHWDKIFQYCS